MKSSKILKVSIESKFAALAKKYNKKKKKLISLGLGEPHFNTHKKIILSAFKAMKQGRTKYSNSIGIYNLRKKIAIKLEKENKIKINVDQILVTPGAKMALSLALGSILEKNDEIINILPCYPSYENQILIACPGARIKNVNLRKDNFELNIEDLKNKINKKTKAIILNFPHNPTGRMLTKKEFSNIKNLLDKQKCWILSDEIYESLSFNGQKHYSFGSVKSLSSRVITINGFSKAYSMTGWRIGYLCAPKIVIDKANLLQQNLNTNVPEFSQIAASKAMKMPKSYLRNNNLKLLRNWKYLKEKIALTKNLKLNKTYGGLFAFINIAATKLKSDKFCYLLLKKYNVASIPGIYFGNRWDDHFRVSLSCKYEEFKNGINCIVKFTENL